MHQALNAFITALFCLVITTNAHGHTRPLNDLPCPPGFKHSFVQNSYQFDGPLEKFTSLTGSFFDLSWYAGGEIINTTGTDNIPGATRVGPFDPFRPELFNETLTMYETGPGLLQWTFTGPGATLTYPSRTGEVIRFQYYAESQRYESICGGTATYIHAMTHICSDNPSLAYDLFYRLHQGAFNGFDAISARVNTKAFTGDCPGV
ncbi:hypothetical protein C8J57DRAFT_1046448 [Mycena rebaudengoi]|nr:hypothetical protein C8J57DRAFT_1046448 [Mycena rebaudengoi]